MIRSSSAAFAAALVFGAVAFSGGASALTVPANPAGSHFVVNSDVDLVNHRKWDRRRHGDRHRRKHGKFVHFHGGHYYASPWWNVAVSVPVLPSVTIGIPAFGTEDYHVYCKRKFRSYDRRRHAYRKGNRWVRCG